MGIACVGFHVIQLPDCLSVECGHLVRMLHKEHLSNTMIPFVI